MTTSTIIGDWPSTVKLGGCEIKFPAGAVNKCTMVAFILTYEEKEKAYRQFDIYFIFMPYLAT
ncbi:unnamed protein product [Clavelina lepadiformis]|uniref:Uncharacterized protein n=1 Tax=Clavelina lepadiformis TaxID=159417 RepID=A0ABP0GE98_CLALP